MAAEGFQVRKDLAPAGRSRVSKKHNTGMSTDFVPSHHWYFPTASDYIGKSMNAVQSLLLLEIAREAEEPWSAGGTKGVVRKQQACSGVQSALGRDFIIHMAINEMCRDNPTISVTQTSVDILYVSQSCFAAPKEDPFDRTGCSPGSNFGGFPIDRTTGTFHTPDANYYASAGQRLVVNH
ncbi:uncharacterized protein BT62DRAFT_1076682 [Guyanagaster necrorhizus]|uniref:Uncharacterized protein n=1 Tax=Guyanagaster necrorhizus TaxID=856835 RepID=A0A9P8AS47_9AGAR|nr:uncharacterized protein BT62DRAFT_1076682 [Guyanagaster necrorhizus MCA 3950]KAG7445596.1 hypothetical protein BT62DRAFT_1076682 [Guyanagaster necrorhizus MCA 3950]